MTKTTFAGRPAYRYRTRSIADTTHLVVQGGSNRVLTVSWTAAGKNTADYEARIDRMLESVRLESERSEMVDIVFLDPEHTGEIARHGCDALAIRRPARRFRRQPGGIGTACAVRDRPGEG